MRFLLFFLGIIFFFIFFLFSKIEVQSSIFESLFLEAHLYIVFVIVTILMLTGMWFRKKKTTESKQDTIDEKHDFLPERKEVLNYIKIFFWKYIYYIGTLFFYTSLILIFQSIVGNIQIPQILLFFNIIVLSFSLFERRFPLFQDLIRVNTITVSWYYIVRNILFLFSVGPEFLVADIINILLLIVLFILFFISSRKKSYIPTLTTYSIIFVFLELSVIIKAVTSETLVTLSFLSFLIGIVSLIYTAPIAQIWHIEKKLVRIWWLCFSYLFLILVSFHIFSENFISGIFMIFVLAISYILYMFHTYFQNYISLFFASFWVCLVSFSLFMLLVSEINETKNLFLLSFFLCFIFLVWEKILWVKYMYDIYFFRIFSLLVNIVWVLCFFFFVDISILKIWVLLLWESLYFFYSYYSLKKNIQS